LTAIFGVDHDRQIRKDVPQFQMDRKRDRMHTYVQRRLVFNRILKKRWVADNKITTFPLVTFDGKLV
jgi:hypothetical protein